MQSHFNERAFATVVRAGDSRRFNVDLKGNRQAVMDSATAAASARFDDFTPFHTTTIKGRPCKALSDYSKALIIRVVSQYISRRFRVERPNRDRIVKAVIEALTDSTPIYIIRRDISSFYESLPISQTRDRLERGALLPEAIRHYIEAYFTTFCASATGIPRGICLSAVLADLAMEEFDNSVRSLSGVYRYFRYSDDILIMSFENPDNIERELPNLLPGGMHFNPSKSNRIDIDGTDKRTRLIKTFEYLGYKYSFDNFTRDKTPRIVKVSIADRKIAKIKTRIFCALKSYSRDKNFPLLLNRLKFISGNIIVMRHGATAIKTSRRVKSGIYYNYKLCGVYKGGEHLKHEGNELKSLDAFYYSLINRSVATLSASQTQALKSISFFKGYALKFTQRFDAIQVQAIRRIWKNV